MECKTVRKRLSAYIDDELDAQTREIVKTHLNLCSTCSLEFDGLKKTLATARAWRARPLPEGFVATVRERAERGETPRPEGTRLSAFLERLRALPRPAWQVAAVCAVLLLGVVLGHVVWPRHVERVADVRIDGNGVRAEAQATLVTLQKLKIILGMSDGNERTIATLNGMQRDLAMSLGPAVADRVTLYHSAEAMIAAGRLDDAEAILNDLIHDETFALAPYARITRLAAQPVPGTAPRMADVLLPEVLGSPERLYEAVRTRTSGLRRAYAEALGAGTEWLEPIRLPEILYRPPAGNN
ncbi:MAG: zf-HC2 domain-containing protein [Verrucomicrobia bacterium]|nr:zf-HC2 domain-containing protein [Verrucomicrobiota bacterium]